MGIASKQADIVLTMEVPNEVRSKYVAIIDDILSQSNLAQVTEKKIRNGIQDRVEYDITPQKVRARKTGFLLRWADNLRQQSRN